uniref:TniQ family protein n=1 Tax=Burkholderia sp. (strain CCGE1003) TaxID=640512 RepID=E1TI43_BURSG
MPEYTGSSPVPYESAFSQVARVATLNEMTAVHFLRLSGRKCEDRNWDVSNSRPLRIDEFQCGLSDVGDSSKVYNIFDVRFCASALRVCDQCVGGMYHSLWHQCWTLSHCPLHGCRLRTVCSFCNRSYGQYTFSQTVKDRFLCRHCANSLSMEPATIGRHLELRGRAAEFETAFVASYRQLGSVVVTGQRLSHLEKRFPFDKVNAWWPESRCYWDVMQDVDFVHRKQARTPPKLTWLVWPSPHHDVFQYRSEVDVAYSETLYLLKRWLIHRFPQLAEAGERPELFDDNGAPRTDLWPPEFMAFMLLRLHVEEDCRSWGVRSAEAGNPRTSRHGIVCRAWWESNWLDSRGFACAEFFKAMVYGRYATLYWAAKNGLLDGKTFQAKDYVLPCFWQRRTGGPHIAAVVFPTIDGLPLGRFQTSPLTLKDAVEVLYHDGISIQRQSLAMRRAECG